MKKKFLSFIFAICLMIPCFFLFSACGKNPPEEPETTQSLTKAEYAEAFAGVQSAYNSYMNSGEQSSSSVMSTSAYFNENDLEKLDREMTGMARACIRLIAFLENLCENEDFEVTEDFQEMIVIDPVSAGYVQNFDVRIKMSYNPKTEVINSEMYVIEGDYITYLVFDILYNFKTEKIKYFTITGAMGEGLSTSSVRFFKFEDNEFKTLPQSSDKFTSYAESILDICDAHSAIEWGTNLPD